MKEISHTITVTLEHAYDSQKECDETVKYMIENGYVVIKEYHDVWEYYRKFEQVV